jgi:toluene monooxygenase electron transfer component
VTSQLTRAVLETCTVQVDGGPSFEVAAAEDTLLRGALRSGVGLPHECSVGACGACRFELLAGDMETLWQEAPGLSERDRRRGKRLACQSRPLGDCVIRVRCGEEYQPAVAPRRFEATLRERRALSGDMTEFTLMGPGPAEFLPGQYALLYPHGVSGARAYSMSNLPNAEGVWQFIVRRVPGGRGSASVFENLVPGARITVDGPYGHAYLRPGTRDVVCVAGGSGVGPMLSVARAALAEEGARRVHFFLGLRSQSDLGVAALLEPLACERLSATTVLSSPEAGTPWSGATGFVHEAMDRRLASPRRDFEFFFAGPPPMVDALQQLLLVRGGVPFGQIHFDRFF